MPDSAAAKSKKQPSAAAPAPPPSAQPAGKKGKPTPAPAVAAPAPAPRQSASNKNTSNGRAVTPAPVPTAQAAKPGVIGAKVGMSEATGGPAPMHRASRRPKEDRFAAPVEPLPAPATGPLTFEDVLALAIHNDPDVLRYVGETEVAIAEHRAAGDWEDPELRLTWGWQSDVEVGSPYFERETISTRSRESRFNRQGEFSTNEFGFNEFQIDSDRTRASESRFRTIERRVVPGATQTTIYEREYESRNANIRGSRFRRELDSNDGTQPIESGQKSGMRESDRRRMVHESKTVVQHPDVTDPEDQFGIMLRIPFMNSLETRARKARTEAAIHDHNWERKYAEYEVMLKVREEYDKMAIYEALKNSWQKLRAHRDKFTDVAKALLPEKIAAAADDSAQAVMNVYDAGRRAEAARLELARMAGISDPKRIVAPRTLLRRRIDMGNLQLDYLIQMASIHRADLQRVRAQHDAARAEWREYQAKKIPWAAYFDLGYELHGDREGRDTEEWFVRLGVSLPLWSWLRNKEGGIYEAAARGYSRQIGRLHDSIPQEVINAVEGIRVANKVLDDFRKRRSEVSKVAQQSKAAAAGSDRVQELMSESEDLELKMENYELDIIRFYNERVLELERALGTRLETVFDGPGSGSGSK